MPIQRRWPGWSNLRLRSRALDHARIIKTSFIERLPHSGSVLCTLEFDHASFYALELALDICQKARSLRRDVERQFASHSELLKTLTDNSVSTVSVANHTRAMKRLSAIYADKLWDDNIQVIEDAFVALWL